MKLEVILPSWLQKQVVEALKKAHPYEEVAFELYPIKNELSSTGAGMIGNLPEVLDSKGFLKLLKENMELEVIRFTPFDKPIRKVAICGGAGSFLLKTAIAKKADAFVSADFKYHEFFDSEEELMIADIGHYESEKFTKNLLSDLIINKFPNQIVRLSHVVTNPIQYFT
jgi:putative NIF3 family GTP cyclohydrolase 1 type 2